MKIGLICGGPSPEKGISLNSARSVMDHLADAEIIIVPFYLDQKRNVYKISTSQLYSNTPSDFDFKLSETATPLSSSGFVDALKRVDIVFPVMHGSYGEDGTIQRFLEKHRIPFVGSGSEACRKAFDKFDANEYSRSRGFFTLPTALLKIYHRDHRKLIDAFFAKHTIERAIVKPASGGSSIGVFSVSSAKEAFEKVRLLFSKRADTRIVIEPFAKGVEFTVIILENPFGLPVSLPPTEIEIDYREHQIFDFRKKYLPTRRVTWHSPPRFSDEMIEKIQAQAEQLFALFGLRDFARFDGWVLESGDIWFCDFNTISGMEQNSFLFQQSSRVGMTHQNVLRYILKNACARYALTLPRSSTQTQNTRKRVSVLFGGTTSERQVSLMSGTNVWLKLRGSSLYEPHPYLLDTENHVWKLPYDLTLNHTVEEVSENCSKYAKTKPRLESYEKRARLRLGLPKEKDHVEFFDPQSMTLSDLMKDSVFVFNALHGGAGEDGTLQAELTKHGIHFNGSAEEVSRLCIDKWATSKRIRNLSVQGVGAVEGKNVATNDVLNLDPSELLDFWRAARKELRGKTLIIKPRADGCSTGVAHLYSSADLVNYLTLIRASVPSAPVGTFKNQASIIEMPAAAPTHLLFERYIETDRLRVKANRLKHTRKTGWVEITIGVIEKEKRLFALNPSIAVAEGEVLTVEEKFQGGTGINLTPPPSPIIKPPIIQKIRARITELARGIGITGYARIDAFAHTKTGELLIIEINTLPGLTPSTVLYHQALAEHPPLYPRELLELLIENKGY